MGARRGLYRRLVGKTEGKGPLGRPKRRYEDLQEVESGVMDWIYLGQYRERWRAFVKAVMSFNVQ